MSAKTVKKIERGDSTENYARNGIDLISRKKSTHQQEISSLTSNIRSTFWERCKLPKQSRFVHHNSLWGISNPFMIADLLALAYLSFFRSSSRFIQILNSVSFRLKSALVKTGWGIRLHHSSRTRHNLHLIVIEVATKIETGSVKKARTCSL